MIDELSSLMDLGKNVPPSSDFEAFLLRTNGWWEGGHFDSYREIKEGAFYPQFSQLRSGTLDRPFDAFANHVYHHVLSHGRRKQVNNLLALEGTIRYIIWYYRTYRPISWELVIAKFVAFIRRLKYPRRSHFSLKSISSVWSGETLKERGRLRVPLSETSAFCLPPIKIPALRHPKISIKP